MLNCSSAKYFTFSKSTSAMRSGVRDQVPEPVQGASITIPSNVSGSNELISAVRSIKRRLYF